MSVLDDLMEPAAAFFAGYQRDVKYRSRYSYPILYGHVLRRQIPLVKQNRWDFSDLVNRSIQSGFARRFDQDSELWHMYFYGRQSDADLEHSRKKFLCALEVSVMDVPSPRETIQHVKVIQLSPMPWSDRSQVLLWVPREERQSRGPRLLSPW
jgi:hypothetical protein